MKSKALFLTLVVSSVFLGACASENSMQSQKPANAATANNAAANARDLITDAEAVKTALNVGAKMPSFTLKDIEGKPVASDDLLKKGNLVIVFYRGAWCPFCNTYLQNLQKNAPAIKAAGGEIVAISVENPDNSSSVARKNELDFTVLSDPQLETARKFGIVYQLSKETNEKYQSGGLDVAKHNEMDKAELPLGATYIVTQQGEIVYAYLDPDYTKRAEPEVIIENLRKIPQSKTGK